MKISKRLNPFTGKFDLIADESMFHVKDSVDTHANLPITGNGENDMRFVEDTDKAYVWSIANPDGNLADWKLVDTIRSEAEIKSIAKTDVDIADAILKKHSQNTDEYLNTQVTKTLYVDKNRTDSYTENGSITKPYKLIQTAIDSITDASSSNRYAIYLNPGDYSEALSCKPYISFIGISRELVKLSGLITINITNGRIAFKDLVVKGGLDMDTSVAGSVLDLEHCWVGGAAWDINMTGSGWSNYFQTWDDQFQVNITINNTFMALQDTLMYGNIVMNGDSHAQFYNGEYYGTTDLNGTTDYIIKSVNPYPPVIINVNTAGASLSYDAEFGGATINNPGGGTIILLDKASKIDNDSSVVGNTVKDALETLDAKPGVTHLVVTNSIILQANGANFETINHALAEQFVQATVSFKPSAGTYSGQWINGEGVITLVYFDQNNLRIYNDSGSAIAIGDCKIIIQK